MLYIIYIIHSYIFANIIAPTHFMRSSPYTVLYYITQYYIILHSIILYYTVLYYVTQYYITLHSIILRYTVLYYVTASKQIYFSYVGIYYIVIFSMHCIAYICIFYVKAVIPKYMYKYI